MATQHRPLREIARDIRADWTNPYYGARPYLQAMGVMDQVSEPYGDDSGKSIVLYFLCNAQTWRGEIARKIKKELNTIVK